MSEAIPSWARVGSKVIYVDDAPADLYAGGNCLVVGEVYVLRTVTGMFSLPACQVVGDGLDADEFMRLSRFRPLVSQADDIAAHFQQLLDIKHPELIQ